MHATNAYSRLDYREAPTLFFEFHGSPASVEEQARTVADLAQDTGGGPFQWTAGTEERNRLWSARHDVFWSQKALRPGAEAWTTDVCVPISRLADAILAARDDAAAAGLLAPIVGHVGDGNFHMTFLLDPADPAEHAPRRRPRRWSSGPSPWAAPAPASTASAPARCATSRLEHGDASA